MNGVNSKRRIHLNRDEIRLSARDSQGCRIDSDCDVVKSEMTGEISIRLNIRHFENVTMPYDLADLYRMLGIVINRCCFAARLYDHEVLEGMVDRINKFEYDMIRAGFMEPDF